MEKNVYKRQNPSAEDGRQVYRSSTSGQRPKFPGDRRKTALFLTIAGAVAILAVAAITLNGSVPAQTNPSGVSSQPASSAPAASESVSSEVSSEASSEASSSGEAAVPVPTAAPASNGQEALTLAANNDLAPWPNLQKAVEACEDISFMAIDLNTLDTLAYNADDLYFLSSTVNAAYAYYNCKMIDEGKQLGNAVLPYSNDYYYDGNGAVKYSRVGTQYSLDYLLKEAVHSNDNAAYKMAVAIAGTEGFNQYMESLGCANINLGSDLWPNATARDCARVWYEIGKYLQSRSGRAPWLEQQLVTSDYGPIRKAFYYKRTVASVYGWESTAYNDCAIVYGPDNKPQYALCILSGNGYMDEPLLTTIEVIKEIDAVMQSVEKK